MIEKIDKYIHEINNLNPLTEEDKIQFHQTYLGKSGIVTQLFTEFKTLPNNKKKDAGKSLNVLKKLILSKQNSTNQNKFISEKKTNIDFTLPSNFESLGSEHPLSKVQNKIVNIFERVGFVTSEGPEIEDDWHNFSALNMLKDHPARDMQDTFFITSDLDTLLRTHTSSVQTRYMEENTPPIRIISPGRVYRKEAISARAHCLFHQIEGLYIDKNVTFADLKKMINYFLESLFGKKVKTRFRPSFFPFTEPSAEVDIYWGLKTETDYRITKGTGWLEIMGCGMIDPNVLKNVKIDPNEFSGFAFGLGIERITMLLYQIDDLRLFFENDIRFLKQFKSLS
jgi:phenylalanyl-tRNA synthetase alpha chain